MGTWDLLFGSSERVGSVSDACQGAFDRSGHSALPRMVLGPDGGTQGLVHIMDANRFTTVECTCVRSKLPVLSSAAENLPPPTTKL